MDRQSEAEDTIALRLDKWLWFARVVKTRGLAQDLANSGHVRLNGQRIKQAAKRVRVGDVLTIALPTRVRVLKVAGFAEQRRGADDGARLYEELTERALESTKVTSKRSSTSF